jgi:hypothetical protein
MLAQVAWLLSAGLVLQGSPSPKSWIADLKADQERLHAKEVLIEGDVVDIRSTSTAARAGFYRIIDATDPEGVLIRTDRLPVEGGTLRVRARLAPQQPAEGPLLLDELDQQRIDRRPIAPLVLAVGSLGTLLLVSILLIRVVSAERRIRLSPPLWLLPEAGPYGKALGPTNAHPPALQYAPELEDADRVRQALLQRRKRRLFRVMLGSIGVAGLSVVWFVTTKPASAQVPKFIFISAIDTPIPLAQPAENETLDSTRAVLDSLMIALQESTATQERSRRAAKAVRDSISRAHAQAEEKTPDPSPIAPVNPPELTTASSPSPAPAPPPAPPPPVPVPPDKEEHPRDPEADRMAALQSVTAAAGRLVDAINGKQLEAVARLLPESMAGDLRWRERFMNFLKDYSPRAVLDKIEGTTLAQSRGEARFSMRIEWRADFGVRQRKSGQFVGLVSRSGTDWRFDGARLLNPLP